MSLDWSNISQQSPKPKEPPMTLEFKKESSPITLYAGAYKLGTILKQDTGNVIFLPSCNAKTYTFTVEDVRAILHRMETYDKQSSPC